ncbi:MAG: hypothetical protein DRI90_28120 [Deltaproteobacteria bacterium]|nr:MAG: hypothetical protein DRI90_28120 [Deltaproteobacteria bacterium]
MAGWFGIFVLACPAPAQAPTPIVVAISPRPSAQPLVVPLPKRDGPSLLGTWVGIGQQSDGPSWPMKVKVITFRKGTCAFVDYPSQECAGQWDCTVNSDGQWLMGREHLSKGQGACLDGGLVTLHFDADESAARFEWKGQGITAEAKLKRPD